MIANFDAIENVQIKRDLLIEAAGRVQSDEDALWLVQKAMELGETKAKLEFNKKSAKSGQDGAERFNTLMEATGLRGRYVFGDKTTGFISSLIKGLGYAPRIILRDYPDAGRLVAFLMENYGGKEATVKAIHSVALGIPITKGKVKIVHEVEV